MTPEQQARAQIDSLLLAAGWVLQNNNEFNRHAAVAAREVFGQGKTFTFLNTSEVKPTDRLFLKITNVQATFSRGLWFSNHKYIK